MTPRFINIEVDETETTWLLLSLSKYIDDTTGKVKEKYQGTLSGDFIEKIYSARRKFNGKE